MAELQRLMRDPSVPESELKQYFTAYPDASRPFAPGIIPDPARVEIAPPGDDREGAMLMSWANGLSRLRRQEKFRARVASGDPRPVLVSEGDSWFQFPIFLEDVVDQLAGEFNIWSVDAAGDTLQNMVIDDAEYMSALREQRATVRAFLFSGGGNDIVGADRDGNSFILQVVRGFEPGRPAEWYLETPAFAQKLQFIERCYRAVLTTVAAEFPTLPVICHAYDYSIPGAPDDRRDPIWARPDQWIGRPMRELGIADPQLQRDIVRLMIDRLTQQLELLCGGDHPGGAFPNAWHVDARGAVGTLWADELHPTDAGYGLVAAKFAAVLRRALAASTEAQRARRTPTTA
jgi:lysophospholipase L1-like esterase